MKQIIQSFKTGETILEEVPVPQVKRGCLLIQTTKSLVSLGTERMLVEFGKSNYLQKAKQQPDKVKQVLDNASIQLKMENGSTGVINYFANGSKAYSKEREEVFSQAG